jgi:hypothetical protein
MRWISDLPFGLVLDQYTAHEKAKAVNILRRETDGKSREAFGRDLRIGPSK